MKSYQLITEGRQLQKPAAFLVPHGSGTPAAHWYAYDNEAEEPAWLAVDVRQIPGVPDVLRGILTVFAELGEEEGFATLSADWPRQEGTPLFVQPAAVLPPFEAVEMFGSPAMKEWLAGPEELEKDPPGAPKYDDVFMSEHPVYLKAAPYAMLGSWHFPWPDGDWEELAEGFHLLTTFYQPEPYLEVWYTAAGELRVLQRGT